MQSIVQQVTIEARLSSQEASQPTVNPSEPVAVEEPILESDSDDNQEMSDCDQEDQLPV